MARIFVCDDDEIYTEVVRAFLELKGHSVVHAVDVEDYKFKAQAHPPDLLIVDMQVRGGGHNAVPRSGPLWPTIVVSGMPLEQQKLWFTPSPKLRHFEKPLDLPVFGAAIDEMLKGG